MAQGFADLAQDSKSDRSVVRISRRQGIFYLSGLLILLVVALLGLFAAHQIPASYTLDIAQAQDTATLNNFYSLEKNENGPYRWSQPQAQIHLLPVDSHLRVCLDIEEIFPVERSATLTLDTAGKVVPAFQAVSLSKGQQQYCGETSRLAAFLPGDFSTYKDGFLTNIWFGPALQVDTSPYTPPGDRRELGLLIHSVRVESGAAAGTLGVPTLLEIAVTLVIALGAWGLLMTFRLRPLLVSLLPLLPVAGWLSLVAWGRVGLAGKIEFALFMALATVAALFTARFTVPLVWPDLERANFYLRNRFFPPTAAPRIAAPTPKGLRRFRFSVVGVALAILLLNYVFPLVVTGLDPDGWGFKRFVEIPWWVSLVVVAVGSGIAALSLANFKWKPSFTLPKLPRLNPYWWLALGGVAATLLFYLLRTQDRYGDSAELVNKLKLFLQYRVETGRDDFLIWREREPLDFALHFVLWRGLLNFDWWKPEYTYIFTSVLAGGLFVVVANLLAAHLTRLKAGRWLLVGLLLSPATLLVFFGYIESYTLVTLVALIYAWLGVLAVRSKINIAWPAATLAIAVMLHPQALFLGPSLVFVLLWRAGFFRQGGPDWSQLRQEVLVAGLVSLAGVAAFGLLFIMYNYSWQQWGVAREQFGGSDNGSFKPLLASGVRPNSRELYPILSWDWLVYQFNLQMRLAPLALPLIALTGGWLLAHTRPKRGYGGWGLVGLGLLIFFLGLVWIGSQAVVSLAVLGLVIQVAGLWLARRHIREPAAVFLGSLAAYTWLFSLAWNPDLGSNDWDLLSLNGVFTSLLAGYLLIRVFGRFNGFGRTVTGVVACALALQAGWILYNCNFL
ncbi:MAG: hypothetical protein J0I20_10070 [Chloroflexi bacterium]|nr:hypothetical protein [Chloroflexota bacterium]OJV94555.1 MAG: hypothetical protein BGO39_22740 [Chloroflexi bacterium 54-19]